MSSQGCSLYSPSRIVFRQVPPNHRAAPRAGFTLVELIVAIAILGVLMALLLAALQVSREMARKTSCSNNIRNHLLAIHEFQTAQRHIPAGRLVAKGREYAWCVELLPHLEQQALYAHFDRSRPWNDG